MSAYSTATTPVNRAERLSAFGLELRYLVEVILLGYLVVVFLFWVTNRVFISEYQWAPLAEIVVGLPMMIGIGIVVAPTVFLLVVALFMFIKAKRLKNANVARFWRRAVNLTAVATPIVTGLLFGRATNWRFGPDDEYPGFYDEDFWYFIYPLYAAALLLIWLVLGWALRAAVVKLFRLMRVRPAIEASTSN